VSKYLNIEQVRNVNSTLKNDLTNIADNLGETRSGFLRKKIREKMAKYPDIFKDELIENTKSNITVSGLSSEAKSQLKITSKNLGVKKNSFIIFLLNEIASDYSSEMKKPRID
jgi:hypothetical protein